MRVRVRVRVSLSVEGRHSGERMNAFDEHPPHIKSPKRLLMAASATNISLLKDSASSLADSNTRPLISQKLPTNK